MSTFELQVMKGSLWLVDEKKHENAPDYSGEIKVPPCAEEKILKIKIWDNRETKRGPRSPDLGVRLEDPAEMQKIPNGGTEALRAGQSSSYTPGADRRVKEGDDYNW